MDEYDTGMDKEVKQYFKKIIGSFSWGLMWMLSVATAAFFFGLGVTDGDWKWYNYLFFALAFLSLLALLFYFYRVWRKK